MSKYRYQLISISSYQDNKLIKKNKWYQTNEYSAVKPVDQRYEDIKNGSYTPPEGARVISGQYVIGGIELLLEYVVLDGEPYR
jgi:hypothetical protein